MQYNRLTIIVTTFLLFNSNANAQLTASITAWTAAGCGGVCNGSITVSATSGVPPYTYLWNDLNAQTTATATGLCTMNYMVVVTDSTGDTASVSYTLPTSSGSQIDSVSIIPSTNSSSCNGSIQLFTSGYPVYSYDWSDSPGYDTGHRPWLSPGSYSVTIIDNAACIYSWYGNVPGINCVPPGTYYDTTTVTVFDTTYVTVTDTNYVTVTDTNHSTVTDTNYITITVYDTTSISVTDTLIINVELTGVNPPDTVNLIKIYPNPASTQLIIDNGDYNLMTGYTLQIDNSIGQTLFSTIINQQQFNIDLSTWSGNGTYFVYIVDPLLNIVDIRKIVVQ